MTGTVDSTEQPKDRENSGVAGGDFNSNIPNLVEYTLADIEAATNGFSIKRKLGQGGYGPVYKVQLIAWYYDCYHIKNHKFQYFSSFILGKKLDIASKGNLSLESAFWLEEIS